MRALIYSSLFLAAFSAAASDVKSVESSSCKSIQVNLAADMTTQIVLEQEPKVTLFADKKHFKIVTNPASPRSLAIIPVIDSGDLESIKKNGALPPPEALAEALDKSFKTNLIVIFDHSNQLMFDLHFTRKEKADKILKVTQTFNSDCAL